MNKLQIKILGGTPPCASCKRAEAEAQKAGEKFPGQIEVAHVDALGPEAQAYAVMATPVVVVGDEVVSRGKVMPAEKLIPIIQKKLGG